MKPGTPESGKDAERSHDQSITPPPVTMSAPIWATTRTRLLIGILSALGLVAVLFWRPIQIHCLSLAALHADAPAADVLAEVVSQAEKPEKVLLSFWGTGNIAHRRFVAAYLARASESFPSLSNPLQRLMRDATSDPDLIARELAFAALARTKDPKLRSLALQQISDPDPALRVLGLQQLRTVSTTNEIPIVITLLEDSDPRVIVSAALVLRQVIGHDFGIRSALAVPTFRSVGTDPPTYDVAAISKGVRRWHDWWSEHQGEFSTALQFPPEFKHPSLLRAPPLSVDRVNGNRVDLREYKGKTIILAFWAPDAPLAFATTDALNNFRDQGTAVFEICTTGLPNCAEDHNEHDSHTHHRTPKAESLQPVSLINGNAIGLTANSPKLLVDRQGATARRYGVEDFPTFVLINQGMIARMFVGDRDPEVFKAMLKELEEFEK